MAGILGIGKSKKTAPTIASGLQLQSSTYGSPIPLVYGTTRIAPNLMWYGNFTPIPVSSGGGGKGGISGSGGKGGTTTYNYQVAVQLGLCEGPIEDVLAVYANKNIYSLAELGLTLFTGTYPQDPWGFLTGNYTSKTEAWSIPLAAPYTVTVNNAATFLTDYGVTGQIAAVAFAKVNSGPIANQYTANPNTGVLTFNAANAGATVIILYSTYFGQHGNHTGTIPATAPYTININLGKNDLLQSVYSVTEVASGYTAVGGSPGSNQYSVTDGIYTFNAANAGALLAVSYSSVGTVASYQALPYNGIAHADNAAYQLGSSPQLPNHNFEIKGVYSTSISGHLDADPSRVVIDLLTNEHYGTEFPALRVGSLTVYQEYTIASGLWISPVYNQQTSAAAILDDIVKATNSEFVWSSGVLSIVPYGDQTISANGYTYTAPSVPEYDLTDDDFMSPQGVDPVQLVRRRPADQINSVKLECLDRSNQYNTAIVEAKDQASINTFGLRQAPSKQTHLFCDLTAGQTSAQLQLQRQAIRNAYSFMVDQRYIRLDPMDIVTLTDSYLGLNQQWVRITEITENDDGSLSMVAEEYLNGTGNAAINSFQAGIGFNINYNASPGDPNQPVIFEPTAELAESLEVWMAVSGGENWGGCDVWISYDDQTYKNIGRINGSARTGLLTAVLPSVTLATTGQTIDNANVVEVDLTQSNGQLQSASQDAATALASLCYVDGEYISYQDATLNAANQYALTLLVRGAYGSTISQHTAGTQFARLDDSLFKFGYTQDYINKTVYIKLTSFNIYEGGEQSLADVSSYLYVLQGTTFSSPLPDITNLRTSYIAGITQLAWDEVTDFRTVQYEIRLGNEWTGAQSLGFVAHSPFNAQGDGAYWVSAYSQPTAGMQVYSENPQSINISGAAITSNVIATYDEAATGWSGTLSGAVSFVASGGLGNILSDADWLGTADILNYHGNGYVITAAGGTGTYEIPTGHEINIGRVAACNILISWASFGQNISDDILATSDYLNAPDILDAAASQNVNTYPEIALSQDGITWGAWQKYSAGAYLAMAFRARMQMQTFNPNIVAILNEFIFSVDVPDRDDHYIAVFIGSGGTTIDWTPDGAVSPVAFNGGPAGSPIVPAVQVTVLSGSNGDSVVLSGVSLSQGTVQVFNGGVGVARTVNILVQGF